MLAKLTLIAALFSAFPALAAQQAAAAPRAPAADHHQHLFSKPIVDLLASSAVTELPASGLVALLDAAGIRRAVVFSVAYMYGSPKRKIDDEYAKVRAENDWTAAQAALYPGRLRAFCGFNPLKDYALAELARCAGAPGLRHGLKLHFGNADIQVDDPAHLERLKQVFRAANKYRMAIAVHMRASISRKRPYGAAQAQVFLDQLLPEAPEVPVQVAHMAGTGPGYDDPPSDSAMAVLAQAAGRKDPRTRNLWFDVASVADANIAPVDAARLVQRLREAGLERVVYGTDSAAGDNLRPRESWAAIRKLPLTAQELDRIASNVAPYLRD